jgi:hypothetical protein
VQGALPCQQGMELLILDVDGHSILFMGGLQQVLRIVVTKLVYVVTTL